MIQPMVQVERHKHRQQEQTEESVLRKLDSILELLRTPEKQSPELVAALAEVSHDKRA
jgi:hypothetical protein